MPCYLLNLVRFVTTQLGCEEMFERKLLIMVQRDDVMVHRYKGP